MNLATKQSTRWWENFMMRLGCLLVSVSLLVSLIVEPPRAKAVVPVAVTAGAVSALAAGFLAACGLKPVVSGMQNSDEVGNAIGDVLQDYLDATSNVSIPEWGKELAMASVSPDGRLVIPRLLAVKLGQFASWVAAKYAKSEDGTIAPGTHQIYAGGDAFLLADGSLFIPSIWDGKDVMTGPSYLGTVCRKGDRFTFATGYYLAYDRGATLEFHNPGFGQVCCSSIPGTAEDKNSSFCFIYFNGSCYYFGTFLSAYSSFGPYDNSFSSDLSEYLTFSSSSSLSVDVDAKYQELVDRLTALEEGQSVALDVGATQAMEIQEILQGIEDGILAGNLAATGEVVDEATIPVDPPVDPDPPAVLPDVDGLGLPALGDALTSRFPFSIPWDFYKGVKLLAAPAKTPHFEVDLMAPIANRVGGWKGDTRIVLDFSEYEILGQVCRWTSTIGFCLVLASATKRLIWTA